MVNVASKLDYRSAFSTWNTKASVRCRDARVFRNDGKSFPDALVPILSHPIIDAKYSNLKGAIRLQHLYRFLHFTHKLEVLIVNEATSRLALV